MPWTGCQQKSRSQEPTLPNRLEADYTGTRPGDGSQRAGCTCAPPVPSSRRGRWSLRPSLAARWAPRCSPPGAGWRRKGGVSGEVKGSPLRHWASKARHHTPTSGRHPPGRTGFPRPSDWAEGGESRRRARGWQPSLASRGPAASGPGARHSDAGKQNSFPGWGAQRPEPGARTPP